MIRSRQTGFTLLEAMVAIVVLSSVSFAVFSWVNQSIRMLLRSDSIMVQELLVSDLMATLEITDLQRSSQGELHRDGLDLFWEARIVETRQTKTNAGFTGFHDVTLRRVDVQIFRDELVVADFRLSVVDSDLVRSPREELRL